MRARLSRRDFLAAGAAASGIAALSAARRAAAHGDTPADHHTGAAADAGEGMTAPAAMMGHGENSGLVGDVSTADFDPTHFLYDFDWGQESVATDGRTVRDYNIFAADKDVEIAPGVFFPAWTYNGQVPGPTFRCREGDLLRFHFHNAGSMPHTLHFHGNHPPGMDGVTPVVPMGGDFVYEFEAKPFGLHLYHCHVMPLKRHIHKGLYGAFIIDPPEGRPLAREMVMVLNAFDTNFDNANEVYAVNTVAFHYAKHPIQVKVGEPIRVYLVNVTEFDPLNSFHLHATLYRLYRTGTSLASFELTDNVVMGQGERHVLEFTLDYPGQYMFHAHQSELAELGWMGLFEATA
jgi:manganese oxidase